VAAEETVPYSFKFVRRYPLVPVWLPMVLGQTGTRSAARIF